ncbi:ABC transporter ATP-binding protein [Bacillus sp. 1P10SD]|uniref:ABC transporter ATP-binding protein n=1 Tax=Bacillus sp. 1P10SD TaxID=3132265 RepID=UPI0039A65594
MKDSVRKIILLFNKREKRKMLALLLMMIIAAFLETLGITSIVPFVGIVTNPETIHKQKNLSFLYSYFHFSSDTNFIIFSVILLLFVFIFKNIYLLFFQYAQNKVILNQQVKLSSRLFEEYLKKPYTFHIQRNTAELLRNVNGEVPRVFQGIILSAFQLLTELLVIVFILSILIITQPIATVTASILLSSSVILFFRFFRQKISELGKEQQVVSGAMIKWVNQGLGASKEIKVSGKEKFFINAYSNQSSINVKNNIFMSLLGQVPRYFIETMLVIIVLITMLIIIIQGTDSSNLISTMALFAMAAFRLMPSISRVVSLLTSIRYSQPALTVVFDDLYMNREDNPNTDEYSRFDSVNLALNRKKSFNNEISLNQVFFRYPNQKEYSLKDISLTIPIGQAVAFIGESGAGKTTIVDIILGLFRPEKGRISVDGKDLIDQQALWQKKIGYIPQSIFLSDDTIRANVAFGLEIDEINDQDVWRALEEAQLREFVESLPEKLETKVGERGVRLSGGQRQRIGIARALYHNPEIIFMDEATSALDNETEREIMKAIDGLKGEKTLIIIAHRLSTIENCDIVYKVSKGRLVSTKNKLIQTS